jgi:ATP/maltotriose-dependent transcriptional regulator MalT
VLHDLERQQLFTIPLDDEGSYRYHEVLRAHLEALLVERDGEAGARARFRRAGVLYEDAGLPAEALRCYGRALDRHALGRLLDRGTPLPSGLAWLDALPSAMVGTDPWLLLARARGAVTAGQHAAALVDFQEAERVAGSTSLADTCRAERQTLLAWLDPSAPPPGGWASPVRRATRFDPIGVATSLAGQPDPAPLLARGTALLVGGMVRDARALFEAVLQHRDTGGSHAAAARLALAAASLLADEPGGRRAAEDAESAAERVASGWLARLARASTTKT